MLFSSYINRLVGGVDVSVNGKVVTIEGVSRDVFFLDITKNWKTSRLASNMFLPGGRFEIKFNYFYALDIYYILKELYQPKTYARTPKRTIGKILELLKEKTWIGNVEKVDPSLTQVSDLKKFSIYTPKDYQIEFVKHYKTVTKAYGLKGYMLDSAAGTGKTMTLLYLSHDLDPSSKKIFIVPKNAVSRVWVATIQDILTNDYSVWDSITDKELTPDYQYYVFHYEQLDRAFDLVKNNPRLFSNTFVGLDESHNFNRMSSDRTKKFLDLCALPSITNVVWSSGTPISALGSECIPFLKCIDPYFDDRIEKGFRAIYGADAKRANDILRHRIGHLKFFVPSQDAVTIETEIITLNVKMANGNKYTIDAIKDDLRAFMDERLRYYTANKEKFHSDYLRALEAFKTLDAYKRNPDAFKTYETYIKTFAGRFDPKTHIEMSVYCNDYENKTIYPALMGKGFGKIAKDFKKAKSVYKYVELTVRGEGLGLLGRYRSNCFREIIPYINLPELIDGAKKKTIVFTSYVDVVDMAAEYLISKGYKPVVVYGETNKDLPKLVKKFFDDENANPLIATFQSLSTAVPLIAANRIININQPWRDAIKTQSIARAARLGQDTDVEVYDILLDTDGKDNISTRNEEILKWSQEMVDSILGKENLNLDNLTLEAMEYDMDGLVNYDDLTKPTDVTLPRYIYLPVVDDSTTVKAGSKAYADKEFCIAVTLLKDMGNKVDLSSIDSSTREMHLWLSADDADVSNATGKITTTTPEDEEGWAAQYVTKKILRGDDLQDSVIVELRSLGKDKTTPVVTEDVSLRTLVDLGWKIFLH